jgi:hypothetical protein
MIFCCNKKVYLTLVIGQTMDSPVKEMLIVTISQNLLNFGMEDNLPATNSFN